VSSETAASSSTTASATAGGLTSGIDLALRVVERYLGAEAADATASYMEYAGQPSGRLASRRTS
jgi:transcriptional regulator GlxA family with amidase domain